METIRILLDTAPQLLTVSSTPRDDMIVLLAHVLRRSASWLYAHDEYQLSNSQHSVLSDLIDRRNQKVPVAYLVGWQEFWNLRLALTPAVLVPRPETELLVDCVLARQSNALHNILEIGVGSGAITLALAKERPHWLFTCTDISPAALQLAARNACTHGVVQRITFYQGDLFSALPIADGDSKRVGYFDSIVSNPPYLSADDPHLTDLSQEPRLALVAGDTGLEIHAAIIAQAPRYLRQQGSIYLEHGNQQGAMVRRLLSEGGFFTIQTHKDLQGWERVTHACYRCSKNE